MIPLNAAVDHIFRFFEPENSAFNVRLPPFLQFNHPKLQVCISRPTARIELNKDKQELIVNSRTGSAMDQMDLMVYIYSDNFMSELLATCKVEVVPLTHVYSK